MGGISLGNGVGVGATTDMRFFSYWRARSLAAAISAGESFVRSPCSRRVMSSTFFCMPTIIAASAMVAVATAWVAFSALRSSLIDTIYRAIASMPYFASFSRLKVSAHAHIGQIQPMEGESPRFLCVFPVLQFTIRSG